MVVPMHYAGGLRVLGAVGLASLFAAAFTPLPNLLNRSLGIAPRVAPAGAIVVLGSSIERGGMLTSRSLARTVYGVRLYRQGYAPLLVLLGGPARDGRPAESAVRSDLALDLGVPDKAILVATARTTREEALRVATALTPRGVRTILLVTESQHLVRARGVFEQVGFEVLPAPSDARRHASQPSDRLALMGDISKELAGRLYYRLTGYR